MDSNAHDRPRPIPGRPVLEGVRRRDPEALGQFFEHYFDRVFGLAYRLLGNRSMAEDTTQDVFYKVHRAAERLDPDRDPGPWLVTLTLNTCRSLWRSAAHRASVKAVRLDSSSGIVDSIADPGNLDPAERIVAFEQEALVQGAIADLPESLRVVVILHDYQGLDHKEIASVLGLGHDAVRKRYSRALSDLAQRLRGRLSDA